MDRNGFSFRMIFVIIVCLTSQLYGPVYNTHIPQYFGARLGWGRVGGWGCMLVGGRGLGVVVLAIRSARMHCRCLSDASRVLRCRVW